MITLKRINRVYFVTVDKRKVAFGNLSDALDYISELREMG